MKMYTFSIVVLFAIMSLVLAGCDTGVSTVSNDASGDTTATPEGESDDLLNVGASISTTGGAIEYGNVYLTKGSKEVQVADATVTLYGNILPWASYYYTKSSGLSPSYLVEGNSVALSIVAGDLTASGALTVPSRLKGISFGTIAAHAVNTPLAVSWNGSSGSYKYPPQHVIIRIYVSSPFAYNSYEVPLSDGSYNLPASLFSEAGSSIYVWIGDRVELDDLGPAADVADSYFIITQYENAGSGKTK
jgi:hypothetical protein